MAEVTWPLKSVQALGLTLKVVQQSGAGQLMGKEYYRIRKYLVYLSLFGMLLVSSAMASPTDDAYLHTIDHLLKYVEKSGCVFIRNGKEYNSEEAAKHIKTKYDSLLFDIKTPEEFIELAASKSMLSGQLYWVQCADHSPIPSADWLTKELFKYRKSVHDKTFTK
jgi:hypothetical protein